MVRWIKVSIRTDRTVTFRKQRDFTVTQPLKPGKDNHTILGNNDIQNVRQHIGSYHDDVISN